MDLQENIKQTIRRLLKESEIPKHLLRRLDFKMIDEIFKEALTDASKKFAKNKDKWNFMDEYKFNKMVVSYMVDTFFSDEEYYNSELFTEMWDDLYNFFSEYYYDQIRDRYYAIEGESAVVCEDCGWFWYLSDGGDDPYVCHKCGNDNTPKKTNVYESIRRILKEETTNLGPFIDKLRSTYNMSDEVTDFLVDFIEKSGCQKIEFADFKYQALGASLHNGVLINKSVLNTSLEMALFVIFHEIAHQYQYKKYGEKTMYDFYNEEISVMDAAKFMKYSENVADDLGSRKIRELQKMGLINPHFKSPQMYKNVQLIQLVGFINQIRTQLRANNITTPDRISEFYYNLIKREL